MQTKYLQFYDSSLISRAVKCTEDYVRLVHDGSNNKILIKDSVSQGRVEMCIGGDFHTVCDTGWSNIDASVLCSELGFSRYGKFVRVNFYIFCNFCNFFFNFIQCFRGYWFRKQLIW